MKASLKKKLNYAFRIFVRSSIPLALIASSGLIALLGADRWILLKLEKQRSLYFEETVNRISLQLSENILLLNYTNIDTLLLRILDEDSHITCLVVSDNSGRILSVASRKQPALPATIKYSALPKKCNPKTYASSTRLQENGKFFAQSQIKNNNLQLGTITGHAVNDENDLALFRSIELILLGAFGIASVPAFAALSWSSNRQLKIEQEETARISGLMRQLQDAQGRTRAAFEGTNDGWLEWNVQTDECIPSQKLQHLLGFNRSMQYQKRKTFSLKDNWQRFIVDKNREHFNQFLDGFKEKALGTNIVTGIELQIKPIGTTKILTLALEAVVTETVNEQPSVIAIVANNITHEKEQQERINHLAFYDTLTGLRNRFSFEEELKKAEAGLGRHDYRLVIFAIDIDNFKFLNDSHGHAAGDQLLIQAASRLKYCTRKSDFVARLGGDEFVIIYKLPYQDNRKTKALTEKIAKKLLTAFSERYTLKTFTSYNTCSIGICIDNTESQSAATLLDKADIALYKAKEIGRNCFFIYETGMASEAISKAVTTESLKTGIESGATSLSLQPIVRLNNDKGLKNDSQKVIGYEALFRYPESTKSIQYLISCAEEAGIINLITESMLNGIETRLENTGPNKGIYISINISPIEFLEPNFPIKFIHQLRKRKINPHQIFIEITETAVLANTVHALAHMNTLIKEGIRFSLDDFGTGYASIELLRKLPFTTLKIDRSYIKNIPRDTDMKLIKSIVSMAKAFNMELIGEGVETIEQKNALSELNCEFAQGYLFDENGNDRVSS